MFPIPKYIFRLIISLASVLICTASVNSTTKEKKIFNDASAISSQKIDIAADNMEVQQNKNIAIFTGNVDVTRGDLRVKSKKLIVHYAQEKEKNQKHSISSVQNEIETTTSNAGKTEIKFIDAIGNVIITSKDQKATSNVAKMNVIANTAVLTGNVTLTQGTTTIKGKRLDINLTTGKSKMTGGRVRGTFFPQKKKI